MATLDRDGVCISYDVAGSGPPVLLSNGYSATAQMWTGQVAAWSGDYTVITWDMRGHGLSDSPADPAQYSEALTVGDMAAILDACGVERAVIGGLSLGGYMSLAFNVAHPSRVRALVLCDTGPGYRKDEARDGWNAMAVRRAESFEKRGLEALGRSAEVATSTHRSAAGLALAARHMLPQYDARIIDSLPSISVPTLVLVGEKDEQFIAPADYMAAKIPGAVKAVIPDAGHAANIDQPKLFNDAVREFLDTLPA
ncbi:MAG: alpha/beta fold hydrolase [Actinobacteria bacterium]|nr:alpha/beta fold hydrolase [Actinomycetota bacterium]MBV9662702.1 alpha/beta fold hydrolase [Actinomycetota bacterium]